MKPKTCKTCRRRKRAKNRTQCWGCYMRGWRAANPVKAAYILLKSHAKERGKSFTITLSYFKKFCYKYDYINKKGRHAEGYGVDRIREEEGYVPGNLAVLKNGDNTRKYISYDWQTKTARAVTVRQTKDENLPF